MPLADDDKAILAWRNLVVHWHLRQEVPLDCGCDDDTADDGFCAPSAAYADRHFASQPGPALDGDPDPWNYDVWVAAWGRNATLIVPAAEFRLPMTPAGVGWLVTRMLVRGRRAVELVLLRLGEHQPATIDRRRVEAESTTVAACARRMLDDLLGQ